MTQKFCLLICLLLSSAIYAQSPGYMGKKTVVGYGAHVSPVLFGSTANNKTLVGGNGSAETGHLRFNYTHDVFLERALSVRKSIGVSFKYLRTGYDNRATSSVGKPTDYYLINAYSLTPYFKFYHKRFVAPYGKYFVVGPSFRMMKSRHDEYMHVRYTVREHDTLVTNFGSDEDKHTGFDIMFGFGHNRIIADKFTIDYGCNFHFFSTLTFFESLDSEPIAGRPEQIEYIERTIKSRVRGANRFNVFIRFAYLF